MRTETIEESRHPLHPAAVVLRLNRPGAAKAIPSLLMGTLLLPMTIGLKRAKSIYLRGGKMTAQQRHHGAQQVPAQPGRVPDAGRPEALRPGARKNALKFPHDAMKRR